MMYVAASTFALLLFHVLFASSSIMRGSSGEGGQVTPSRPPYIECVDSSECPFDSCCVLGMGRYSTPQCQKKQQRNEICRPASDEAVNTTVTYIDGTVISLRNIHMIMCPCDESLTCDQKVGKCVEFDSAPSYNHVYDNEFQED